MILLPMPKTILAKKFKFHFKFKFNIQFFMLKLIVLHMRMEDSKTLGTQQLTHGSKGQFLLTKINLSRFSI